MTKLISTLWMLTIATLMMPAGAEECVPEEQEPEVDTGDTGIDTDGDGTTDRFYVDNDVCLVTEGGCPSIWIYQESNGIDGLQRWDEHSGDLACGNGDTVLL